MQRRLILGFLPVFALAALTGIGIIAGLIVPGAAQSSNRGRSQTTDARLRQLEDREEIRQLLVDYGRTLDQRDFEAFSKLFAENAEYGGGMGVTKGPAAIGKSLEETFRKNPTGFRSPNFHLFANEIIRVNGDEATALSKGIFVVPGENSKPDMVMLATYTDELTRENGRWKFKRRIVHGDIPAPTASK